MTDRIKGFTVTLDRDIRIDDVEQILNAVRMISGVASVKTVVTNIDDHMARERVKSEIREKLLELYKAI